MDRYEMYEIASTLKASGWTAEDREMFQQINEQEDPENILDRNVIESIFDIIAEMEND